MAARTRPRAGRPAARPARRGRTSPAAAADAAYEREFGGATYNERLEAHGGTVVEDQEQRQARRRRERAAAAEPDPEQEQTAAEFAGAEDREQDGAEDQDQDEGGSRPQQLTARTSFATQGAGAFLALIVYPLVVNFLQGGSPQMWGWIKAKWINQPYGAAAPGGAAAPRGPGASLPKTKPTPAAGAGIVGRAHP